MGKLYDDAGNRMTPAHANKRGLRYRYYVSSALSQGRPAGSVTRVSALKSKASSWEPCASAIPIACPLMTVP
jgi:hypothetical protein